MPAAKPASPSAVSETGAAENRDASPLDPQVLARLNGLKLQVSRVVEGVLAGLHRSPRHGESVDFAEHKEYAPGDDPRRIDWRLFGRTDRYYVKKYEAEVSLKAMLALDLSASMSYGSGAFNKAAYASLLLASLASILLRQGDAVGLSLQFGSRPAYIPPRGRLDQLSDIVGAIEAAQPEGPTHLRELGRRFVESIGRRGMLVLFSDLFDPDPEMLGSLKMLAARGHQVLVFHVLDRDEIDFPFEDPAVFESLEDERSLLVFPRQLRDAYVAEMHAFLDGTRRALSEGGLVYELARTDEPPHQPLIRLLSGRSLGHGAGRLATGRTTSRQ